MTTTETDALPRARPTARIGAGPAPVMLRGVEIRELRYFRAVVEAGSFMAAATALHMSQPPLSIAIRKLETELGVQLLTRSPRGVEPTSAGRYLLEAGSRVLGDVDDLARHLRRHGAGTAGQLTVAAVPALLWSRIPALLRAEAAVRPEVEIRLVDPPPWTLIDLVAERKADLGFLIVSDAEAFAARHGEHFDVLLWEPVPVVAAFGPDRGDLPETVPLEIFAGETLVLPRRTLAVPSLPDAVAEGLATHGVVPARTIVAETIQTSVPLVAAGIAASVLPAAGPPAEPATSPDAGPATPVGASGLVTRPLREELPALTAVAIARRGEGSPAARRLFDSLHDEGVREP